MFAKLKNLLGLSNNTTKEIKINNLENMLVNDSTTSMLNELPIINQKHNEYTYDILNHFLNKYNLSVDSIGGENTETVPVNTQPEQVPVNTTQETVPVNTTPEQVPVNTTQETVPVNTTQETVPVNTPQETVPVNTTQETVPVNTPINQLDHELGSGPNNKHKKKKK